MGVQAPARLWLLEGLPGTGKTTTARRLGELCHARRLPARWWPEEAKDHPATPAALRRRSGERGFDDLCVSAFRDLLQREEGVLILEGSALQSTIRFMFANGWSGERVSDYAARWDSAVASALPHLLLFRVADVRKHFADHVIPHRGEAWARKLVTYVEGTPIAQANGWLGVEGFVRFWTAYQALVFKTAAALTFPTLTLERSSDGRGFEADEVLAFLLG